MLNDPLGLEKVANIRPRWKNMHHALLLCVGLTKNEPISESMRRWFLSELNKENFECNARCLGEIGGFRLIGLEGAVYRIKTVTEPQNVSD